MRLISFYRYNYVRPLVIGSTSSAADAGVGRVAAARPTAHGTHGSGLHRGISGARHTAEPRFLASGGCRDRLGHSCPRWHFDKNS